MDYPVRKVVMTGGSGPIGLALIRKLLKENVEILLLQRERSAKRMYLPDDDRLEIDYCTLAELANYAPAKNDYDVFIHLGWANTRRTLRDNMEEQLKNVAYSCAAVEVAHKAGCHSFVGVGSQAEYGRHSEPLRGDTLCTPENAYGIMKLSACYATRSLCKRYGMRHVWPRVLSGYGIYDNIGSILVSTILKSMDGKKLEFSSGEQIWDFVYLDDIANALFLIAEKGQNNAIYPIGSGSARPLKEYIHILCEKLGKLDEMELGKIPYSENQIMYLEADISELQADTGWKPEVSFEDGIEKTINFYKEWKPQWEETYRKLVKEIEGV